VRCELVETYVGVCALGCTCAHGSEGICAKGEQHMHRSLGGLLTSFQIASALELATEVRCVDGAKFADALP
jgi:hypothetical protein